MASSPHIYDALLLMSHLGTFIHVLDMFPSKQHAVVHFPVASSTFCPEQSLSFCVQSYLATLAQLLIHLLIHSPLHSRSHCRFWCWFSLSQVVVPLLGHSHHLDSARFLPSPIPFLPSPSLTLLCISLDQESCNITRLWLNTCPLMIASTPFKTQTPALHLHLWPGGSEGAHPLPPFVTLPTRLFLLS